jgi:hypothetical protein
VALRPIAWEAETEAERQPARRLVRRGYTLSLLPNIPQKRLA